MTFIKLFSIYFDRTKWVFSCIKRAEKFLFQGADICMTLFLLLCDSSDKGELKKRCLLLIFFVSLNTETASVD